MEEKIRASIAQHLVKIRKKVKVLQDEEPILASANFSLPNFWLEYTVAVHSLTHNVTKLAVILTSPPLPILEHIERAMKEVESSYASLIAVYRSLPLTAGATMHNQIKAFTMKLITQLDNYYSLCLKNPTDDGQSRLVGVLDLSNQLVSNLPKNNLHAVIQVFQSEYDLVKDAHQEISNEVKEQRELRVSRVATADDNILSEAEYRLVVAGLALLKSVRTIIKRTIETLSSLKDAVIKFEHEELDRIAVTVSKFSPVVDEFASSLYPPIDENPQIVENVFEVCKILLDELTLSVLMDPMDLAWLSQLRTSLENDFDEFTSLLASEDLMNLSSLSIET